jgi:hypothetical protein
MLKIWLTAIVVAGLALVCCTSALAQPVPAPAAEVADDDAAAAAKAPAPAEKDSPEAKPAAKPEGEGLASHQQQVAERFRELERLLLRMAELTAPTDPRRAALLRQAVAQSKQRDIDHQFEQLVDLLKQERLAVVVKGQSEVQQDLARLLELLMSEDRTKRIESEKERVREYLKRVNKIIKEQKGIQGETGRGADPRKLADQQSDLSDKTGELAKDLDDDPSKQAKARDKPQDDSQPPEDPQKQPKDDDSKGGESKPGDRDQPENKDKSQDKDKPGDKSKDGGSESKPGQPSEKGNDKSEQKPKPPGDQPDSDQPQGQKDDQEKKRRQKPQDSPPGDQRDKDSKDQDQPSQGKPADQPPGSDVSPPSEEPPASDSPAQKRLEQAQQRMKEAQQKLEEAKRSDAQEKQAEAIKELEQAKADLEEILRQLREEEVSRTLAMLEGRFRKMLDQQVEVYEGTKRLDKVPQPERDRDDEIEAGRLSGKERQIATEADKALEVLREEGSAVAFPEAVVEMRDDMESVVKRLAEAKVGEVTQGIEKDIIAGLEEMIAALQKAQKEMENKDKQGEPQQGGQEESPLVDTLSELKMIRALQMRVNTRTERYAALSKTEQTDTPELLEALKRLAEREERIHKVTRDIVLGRNR